MPEIPRDPRQLARDILAGKVRIEDLARERQMRGGGGGAVPAPRVPQMIPQPRPVPPPVQRVPVRQPQRPMPPQQRSMPSQQRPMPQRQMPAQQQRTIPMPQQRMPQRPQSVVAVPHAVPQAAATMPEPPVVARAVRKTAKLNELVLSKQALRQGILLAEVLGKPVALRDER